MGNTTNGSPVITGLPNTSTLITGLPVSGAGIPASATIASIDSPTQITLNMNATATAATTLTFGNYFNGTSAANPNMAGYASLVWSVNTAIKGADLRQILIDTAMDLDDPLANLPFVPAPQFPGVPTPPGIGTLPGRDHAFGYGLVNVGAAVRRAYALKLLPDVAMLYAANAFLLDPAQPTPTGPIVPSPYAMPPSVRAAAAGWSIGGEKAHNRPGMPRRRGHSPSPIHSTRPTAGARWAGANVENGTGVLNEDARFTSRFSQTFDIPAGAISLQFTIHSAAFGVDPSGPPDAFEAALLNDVTGQSLVGAAQGLSLTDAFLNIQSDAATYFGSRVTVGGASASGALGDYSQPQTVVVDLTGITANTTATLYFDLLGFGGMGSQVVIDDVLIVTGAGTAPTNLELNNATVVENSVAANIGTLTVTDPDVGDTHLFTVSDNRFEVVDAILKLKAGISLDYEAEPTVPLTITATDSTALPISRLFTITVLDINLPPTADSGRQRGERGSTASVTFSNQVDSEGVATMQDSRTASTSIMTAHSRSAAAHPPRPWFQPHSLRTGPALRFADELSTSTVSLPTIRRPSRL
jgi:hypothetical protein